MHEEKTAVEMFIKQKIEPVAYDDNLQMYTVNL